MASLLQSLFVRDVGALRQAAAERDVLARRLVERDQEVIGRDSGSRDDAIVQGLQQRQPLLLRAAGDEGDLKDDQVIRVVESQERRGMTKLAARQNVDNLEEVFRRNAPNALMSPFCTAPDTLRRRASLYCPSRTWILATGMCGLLSLLSSVESSGDETAQIGRAAMSQTPAYTWATPPSTNNSVPVT